MAGPLDGILVVSIDQAVAAPYAASRLADAGARVIKVERPGGDFARGYDSVVDGESAYFVWLNRGKESIELDLKNPADAAVLHRMIARADVFIQNLAPGAAARAGFGSTDLGARHPRLITCDISGYGEDGPYRDRKAYDLLIQAETGLTSITGAPEAPGRVGVSICDIAAGMHALAGILEALFERERTGQGKSLEISLFQSLTDWMTVPLWYQENTGAAPARVGLNHPSIAPYGAYPTRDGPDIVIAIQNEREWARLCADVLDDPAMATAPAFANNEARVSNRTVLDATVGAAFARRPRQELVARLTGADIAFGSVNSVADLAAHPQLRRAAGSAPGGPVRYVAPPIHFAGETPALRPVPRVNEQGTALRAEFAEDGE